MIIIIIADIGNCESEDGDSAHEEDDVTNDELANSTEWSSRFGDNLTRVLLPNKQVLPHQGRVCHTVCSNISV